MKGNLEGLLSLIIEEEELHAKWLNTLSYLENCGARKIAACEHPTIVKEEMLKHASEEFRHSHYLKSQIKRVTSRSYPTFAPSLLLGGMKSLHYLNRLDIWTSRVLTKNGYDQNQVRELSYLLVTYAIELRAREIYPIYERLLREKKSKVFVKSIILEEEEHLKEMEQALSFYPEGELYAEKIRNMEETLYQNWINDLSISLGEKSHLIDR